MACEPVGLDWSRVQDTEIPTRKIELPTRERRKAGQYIPPVSLAWFDRACVLPGKALAVGLVLWRLARLKKTNNVVLTNAALKRHGLSRWVKCPALQALERAGLVAVRRRPKRSPEITLLTPSVDGC
jgi:hypothetical protein